MVAAFIFSIAYCTGTFSMDKLLGVWEATDGTGVHALHSRVRYASDGHFHYYTLGYPERQTGWNAVGTYSLRGAHLRLMVKRIRAVGVPTDRQDFANKVLTKQFASPEDTDLKWLDSNHFKMLFKTGRRSPLVYSRVKLGLQRFL